MSNHTHLWSIELRKFPDYLNILKSWLSTRELSRANRLVVEYKRNHQIQSKAWLRWLLAHYTDSSASLIKYHHGPLGKPFLDSDRIDIQFNATDSGNTLLIAFDPTDELGLDIEAIPRDVNYQAIAKKKLTIKEYQLLLSLPEDQQTNAFLAMWTRKEAYGKAIGVGIRYPMNQIHLCDEIKNAFFEVKQQSRAPWYLTQISGENFIACLVSSKAADKIKFYKLDIDSLVMDHD